MANVIKPLFRGAATTGSSNLYTTPDSTTTMVTAIMIVNSSASAQTYTLSLGGIPIASAVSIGANDSVLIEPKQALAAAATIDGLASATSVYFHITGLEIS